MAEGKILLEDSISKEEAEKLIDREDNEVWHGQMNFDNFYCYC